MNRPQFTVYRDSYIYWLLLIRLQDFDNFSLSLILHNVQRFPSNQSRNDVRPHAGTFIPLVIFEFFFISISHSCSLFSHSLTYIVLLSLQYERPSAIIHATYFAHSTVRKTHTLGRSRMQLYYLPEAVVHDNNNIINLKNTTHEQTQRIRRECWEIRIFIQYIYSACV